MSTYILHWIVGGRIVRREECDSLDAATGAVAAVYSDAVWGGDGAGLDYGDGSVMRCWRSEAEADADDSDMDSHAACVAVIELDAHDQGDAIECELGPSTYGRDI